MGLWDHTYVFVIAVRLIGYMSLETLPVCLREKSLRFLDWDASMKYLDTFKNPSLLWKYGKTHCFFILIRLPLHRHIYFVFLNTNIFYLSVGFFVKFWKVPCYILMICLLATHEFFCQKTRDNLDVLAIYNYI